MPEFIPSCDTMVVLGKNTRSGQNLFAKNSDRDVTEAQVLKFFPASDHQAGEKVKCTYLEILQVPHTYALIGSKPWWIWGFEHGVNEWGVAIGNEAEWSNVPPVDKDLLLGMDIIRLALERSRTAKEAVDVITFMIEVYGQGGACRYGAGRFDYNYHNSFIVCDKDSAYLVETVQNHWAYKRIDDYLGISNVYTLGDDFDECSKDIMTFALHNDCYLPKARFDFSKAFQLRNSAKCGGFPRAQRSNKLLKQQAGKMDVEAMATILRDHYEGEFIENRFAPTAPYMQTICMHGPDNYQEGSQTAASMIVDYHQSNYPELSYTCWCSMAPACCSILMPFYNTGYIPEVLGIGNNRYSEDSFWWKMKRLNVAIEADYNGNITYLKEIREPLENSFRNQAAKKENEAKLLFDLGRKDEAIALLNAFTDDCLKQVNDLVEELITRLETENNNKTADIFRSTHLREFKVAVGMNAHKKISIHK